MLTVTEGARARLARRLDRKKCSKEQAIRFVRDEDRSRWSMHVDSIQPADVHYAHQGRTVLIIDEESAHRLRNRLLEVRETDEGPRLRLRKT
jgi:Fe-S cluster assembly iron-binding protein IscA